MEIENQKFQENSQNSDKYCQQLLNKHYAIINQKIMNGQYNGNNTDEYLKDYETFINGYKSEAKGNGKLKCLISFLEVNKPNYIKCLVGSIEKENQGLLLDANKKLEDSKKRRKEQEEQYKQLKESYLMVIHLRFLFKIFVKCKIKVEIQILIYYSII